MPTYDYICDKCGSTKEVFHSMNEIPKIICEKKGCTTEMRKDYNVGAPYIHPNAIPTRKNNSGINPRLRKSKNY